MPRSRPLHRRAVRQGHGQGSDGARAGLVRTRRLPVRRLSRRGVQLRPATHS